MKDSKDDILAADLLKFAYTQGYTEIDRRKSTTLWPILKNPTTNDKIMINQKGRNGAMFFRNTDPGLSQDTGNIFNFCINRLGGFPVPTRKPSTEEWRKAFKILKSFIGEPDIDFSFKASNKTGMSANVKLRELRERTELSSNYLSKYRNIDPKILDHPLWAGTVAESKSVLNNGKVLYNTSFVKKDVTGKTVGFIAHFYSSKAAKHEKRVNEKTEGLFYSNFNGHHNNLYIGETAIDCLSHYQVMSPEKPAYISTGGQISNNKIKLINELIDSKGKPEKVHSIMDNDYTGYFFALQLAIGVHNHNNPNALIETVQNTNFTRYVLHGNPNMANAIKDEIKRALDKETMVLNSEHLRPYLNIGYTKDFTFVELPRDTNEKVFRFMNPFTKAIYKQNDIKYTNEIPPTIEKALKPTKDWSDYLQSKKKDQGQVSKKGLRV